MAKTNKNMSGENNGRYSHGLVKHPLYNSWKVAKRSNMVCEEWKDFKNFYDWAILDWREKSKLFRIDQSKNYCPENCYFRPKKETISKVASAPLPKYISIVCEYCGLEFNRARNKKHVGKICCTSKVCIEKKKRETSISNIGVEHHSKLETYSCEKLNSKEAKIKRNKTNLERYGGNPFSNEDIKIKIKNHYNSKYGVDNASQVKSIKEKQVSSLLQKYGVKTPLKSKEILEKQQSTTESRYGYKFYAKTEDFKSLMSSNSRIYNGKSMKELSEEAGKAYSTFVQQKNKYGIEYAISAVKKISGLEYKFESFLKEENISYEKEVRIENYRADFLIKNIIVELDGLFWHSDSIIVDKQYHKNKRELYLQKNLVPIFFREDEIIGKFDIVKSVFKNKLNISNKIFARKCKIENINKDVGKEFIINNHLMKPTSGEYIGLTYNGEIVCIMQFLVKSKEIHIQRFCNKINSSVVGGYSKLLKVIKNNYNKDIINFVDLRYGSGKHLLNMGFIKESEHISFMWTDFKNTFHRMQFPNNTGYDNNFRKIWDCGQAKFVCHEYSSST